MASNRVAVVVRLGAPGRPQRMPRRNGCVLSNEWGPPHSTLQAVLPISAQKPAARQCVTGVRFAQYEDAKRP